MHLRPIYNFIFSVQLENEYTKPLIELQTNSPNAMLCLYETGTNTTKFNANRFLCSYDFFFYLEPAGDAKHNILTL